MRARSVHPLPLVVFGACTLAVQPALALVRFNDGKDQIHVNLAASAGYDSNIFSRAGGEDDFVWNASLILDYARRAGMIGVNGRLGFDAGRFDQFSSEDYLNPSMELEFTKGSGRTTGSLLFNAARESRADTVANARTESWEYEAALKARYPVIDRYSVSGGASFQRADYLNNPALVDLDTATLNGDLFYSYNSQRDLIAGYRLRRSESTRDTLAYDHALTAGVAGKILPKLNGTLRLGYQWREVDRAATDESFSAVTAALVTTWAINRRHSLIGQVAKDFSTTSTEISTDASSVTLDYRATFTSRVSASAGVGYGTVDFLGLLGAGREDTNVTARANVTVTSSELLSVSLSYNYLKNWSTLAVSDFDRHAITLGVTSRF